MIYLPRYAQLPIRLPLALIRGRSLCKNCAVILLSKCTVGDGQQLPTRRSLRTWSQYILHGTSHLCIYWTRMHFCMICPLEPRIFALPRLLTLFAHWYLPYVTVSPVQSASVDLYSGWEPTNISIKPSGTNAFCVYKRSEENRHYLLRRRCCSCFRTNVVRAGTLPHCTIDILRMTCTCA
jgi:hypothetical protein